jgi:hypothetical protein
MWIRPAILTRTEQSTVHAGPDLALVTDAKMRKNINWLTPETVNRKGDRAGPPRSNNAKTPDKEMKENAASLKDADSFKGIYANARFVLYFVVAMYGTVCTVPTYGISVK